jgi:hypothetical protein
MYLHRRRSPRGFDRLQPAVFDEGRLRVEPFQVIVNFIFEILSKGLFIVITITVTTVTINSITLCCNIKEEI